MGTRNRSFGCLLAVGVALALPRAAAAVDGVIEINQARALAGGVTPTDDPGFPVIIDRSGSYRLTGDLVVDAEQDAILITAVGNDVRLDLNGFSITKTGTPCCRGVVSQVARLYVHGGEIAGFTYGIWTDPEPATVESVHLVGNGLGIGPSGVLIGPQSTVADSLIESFSIGMSVGYQSTVRGCTVRGNSFGGIQVLGASLVTGNIVTNNAGNGIGAGNESTISSNVVTANGVGIAVSSGCTVLDNTVSGNSSFGIGFSGAKSGYARNVLTDNNGGDAQPQISGAASAIQFGGSGSNVCGAGAC